jgi:poly-gamma-glutamate capsule biosynthesis protein CapA/YwtB (metallophosphatase superfamily)
LITVGTHRLAVAAACVSIVAGCSFGPEEIEHLSASESVTVAVVDERGDPVVGAAYDYSGLSEFTDESGEFDLRLSQPVAGVVTSAGKLAEPLVISPTDKSLRVVLLDRVGPTGPRVAFEFGGDVMLGRRYQSPQRRGTATAHDSSQARAVVDDLAPIASSADLTVVNVETVIGELPADDSAAGKRFLIQSPPQIMDALQELGVDAVMLGNNHSNDWGDDGVISTLGVLGPSGIAYAGAGMSPEEAAQGIRVPAGDRMVGLISATSVDGDFVNDQLPTATDEPPADLPEEEQWQYEERTFGFGSPGVPGYVAVATRRAGAAWRTFTDLEQDLSEERLAALWAALTAPDAYPELQDWTARRGHGGAAEATRDGVASEIERLRAEGADTVVVQFHAGFQFAERPSEGQQLLARHAIEDGADMVIAHHPHVLQGFEWYRGKLIAYSLGNLLFDQDFLITYPSAMLRVVMEGDQMIEARAIPLLLIDYRPVPVAGTAAQWIVRLLDTRSALPGISDRVSGLDIGVVMNGDSAPDAIPADVVFDRNTGRIVPTNGNRGDTAEFELEAGQPVALPPCTSLRADLLPAGVEYGVDLYPWGGFDDIAADGERVAPAQWVVRSHTDRSPLVPGRTGRRTDDALQIQAEANLDASTRIVSRAPIHDHRWFDAALDAIDDAPEYTLEFDVRRTTGDDATVRFDVYDVEDVDPTRDPLSTLVRSVEVPFSVTRSNRWGHIALDIDPSTFADIDGKPVDATMITFKTPKALFLQYTFDNVQLMEWRAAPAIEQPIWAAADALRSDHDVTATVTVAGCPAG